MLNFFCIIFLGGALNSFSCERVDQALGDTNFRVQVAKYFNSQSENELMVMILPPTGGENFIDRSYAKMLCKKGIDAVILTNWTGNDEKSDALSIHDRFYRRAQTAIELVINTYKIRYKLGILGTSVGGLHAAIATSRFKEITKSMIIVGGAPIREIIAITDHSYWDGVRERRFKHLNIKSQEEYIELLRPHVPFEPLKLDVPLAQKLAMVISTSDSVVPTKNQLQLRDYWKPQDIKYTRLGHKLAIVKTWLFDAAWIAQFFQ